MRQDGSLLPPSPDQRTTPSVMVGTDIDSSELSALENIAADELDDMTDEQAQLFVQQLNAEADVEFPPERLALLDKDLQELGMSLWIQRHVIDKGFNIRNFLIAKGIVLPNELLLNEISQVRMVGILKTVLLRMMRNRPRLTQYNSPDDAVELIRKSRNIVVLTGAGISVSCGIPDFRSRDGIYASLEGKYGLDEPEDMFDKTYFMHNPNVFFDFAHSIFPSNFKPSASHRFVKLLQDKDKLLRNYTQNIDTLEQAAGISRVLQCHGSFATATCTNPICEKRVEGSAIKGAIFARQVPVCPDCITRKEQQDSQRRKKVRVGVNGAALWADAASDNEEDELPGLGVLKPDITFFGENLSRQFDVLLEADRPVADLIIIAGTSLKVAPVADLLTFMPHRVPVIVINKTPILHFQSDIMLLGNSDSVCSWLAHKLEWDLPPPQPSTKVIGKTSAAEHEAEAETEAEVEMDQYAPPPTTVDEKAVPDPYPVLEPTKWDGADYIWAWPDAELGTLEAMRARKMAEALASGMEEDEEEDDQSQSESPEEAKGGVAAAAPIADPTSLLSATAESDNGAPTDDLDTRSVSPVAAQVSTTQSVVSEGLGERVSSVDPQHSDVPSQNFFP